MNSQSSEIMQAIGQMRAAQSAQDQLVTGLQLVANAHQVDLKAAEERLAAWHTVAQTLLPKAVDNELAASVMRSIQESETARQTANNSLSATLRLCHEAITRLKAATDELARLNELRAKAALDATIVDLSQTAIPHGLRMHVVLLIRPPAKTVA